MTKSKGKNAPRVTWDDSMINILKLTYAHQTSEDIATKLGISINQVYNKAHALGLKKSIETIRATAKKTADKLAAAGMAYRFQKGSVPFNKGRKGFCAPGSEKGHFKKGSTPQNWQPIGSYRTATDGYMYVKMTDLRNPARKDWMPVHQLIWTRLHGREIPAGYCIRFRDRNTKNFAYENLELISRRDNMSFNTLHNYGTEIAQVYQLRGAITRQINKKRKAQQNEQ